MTGLRVSKTSDDNLRGAMLMLGSSAFFVLAGLAVKVAAADMPTAMIVFFRNAVAAAILLPWVWRELAGHFSNGRYGMHIVRTVASNILPHLSIGFIRLIWPYSALNPALRDNHEDRIEVSGHRFGGVGDCHGSGPAMRFGRKGCWITAVLSEDVARNLAWLRRARMRRSAEDDTDAV